MAILKRKNTRTIIRKELNMNNLSEEEIIDVFNTIISANRFSGVYTDIGIIIEAMKSLLDLYNKKKEKNTELTEQLQEANIKNMELIEKDNYWKINAIPKTTIDYLYISKDKIREILNKYDEQSNVKNIYWYETEKDKEINEYREFKKILRKFIYEEGDK